jgi:hypothetical protein
MSALRPLSVESRMGAVAWAMRQRSVSHPRSSNRACRFPAPGFPTSFIEGHTGSDPTARGICTANNFPSPLDTATSNGSGLQRCCQAYRQSPRPRHLRKRTGSQGPLLRRRYPASTLVRPCPTPVMVAACCDVEAATLAHDGSPPITRTTFPTCRAHYPGGSSECVCRLLPRSYSLPQMAAGSASALSLSRPSQASLALRPAGSLSCPRQPLSRGSNPRSCPHEPLVSYRINRQLSEWNLPPLMVRALGAHCQNRTHAPQQTTCIGCKMIYTITSSARASSVGGTSRPSALAALRLMISSTLVGNSTGKSAGLAPFNILST